MLIRATTTLFSTSMPATRSAAKAGTAIKRNLSTSPEPRSPKKPKTISKLALESDASAEEDFIPANAILTFKLEEARKHLIAADPRFADVFARLPCKPFEGPLEQVHPFQALASAILGQQISTLAARSIQHRFIRLYNLDLPAKYIDYAGSFFPKPGQVARTEIATLRSAGLSQRKAEYIKDLAERFSDGRLSAAKIQNRDDDELRSELTQVRGIGQWTVDMFAIFSLRRPDILPVGDLGVQRGIVRWILSQHDATHEFNGSPKKKPISPRKAKQDVEQEAADARPQTPPPAESGGIPLPPTFTPSIQRTLKKPVLEKPSLEAAGLSVAELKARLNGKKIKGAFLTPAEMDKLTEKWKPFSSVGVYYMWALADAENA
ncbi:DNA-3-methyladenine glycosidase [Mycena kentingensis (nom. inval.)]|nr:DNA-3-methyladenine glycosidase [Mycena kentingensis (nom. inval.)]